MRLALFTLLIEKVFSQIAPEGVMSSKVKEL